MVVFAVSEFTKGAWVVVVVMPLLVYALVTMNREYRAEDAVLEEGAAVEACEAKVLRRHTVMVLVDRIDLATTQRDPVRRPRSRPTICTPCISTSTTIERTCSSSVGNVSACPACLST